MPGSLGDLAKTALLIVGTLFPIVNPIGNTPIFLSLTRGLSSRDRTTLARMSSADLVQQNGFGASLWIARYSRMAFSSCCVLR